MVRNNNFVSLHTITNVPSAPAVKMCFGLQHVRARAIQRAKCKGVLLLHRPPGPGTGNVEYGSLLQLRFYIQLFLDDAKMKNFITCFKGDHSFHEPMF